MKIPLFVLLYQPTKCGYARLVSSQHGQLLGETVEAGGSRIKTQVQLSVGQLLQYRGSDRESRLTSMLTGSMVLIWTLGAEDERSRWPNWFRWSSSLGRKLGGMGMDLDGDTVGWHIDLQKPHLLVSLRTCRRHFLCLQREREWKHSWLTRWSQMGGVTDRPQTQGWFPLRRPPLGWMGDAQRTWTQATSCEKHTWSGLAFHFFSTWQLIFKLLVFSPTNTVSDGVSVEFHVKSKEPWMDTETTCQWSEVTQRWGSPTKSNLNQNIWCGLLTR